MAKRGLLTQGKPAPAPAPATAPAPRLDDKALAEVRTTVAEMEQRLDAVLTMLSQQQEILAMLVKRRLEEPSPSRFVFPPSDRRPSDIQLAVEALLEPSKGGVDPERGPPETLP